jgi:hypothetical protein
LLQCGASVVAKKRLLAMTVNQNPATIEIPKASNPNSN